MTPTGGGPTGMRGSTLGGSKAARGGSMAGGGPLRSASQDGGGPEVGSEHPVPDEVSMHLIQSSHAEVTQLQWTSCT